MGKKPEWAFTPFERERAAKRLAKAKLKNPLLGIPRTPYGEEPGEEPGLKILMEMWRRRLSTFVIADKMNQMKIPPRGKMWYETTVKRIAEYQDKISGIN